MAVNILYRPIGLPFYLINSVIPIWIILVLSYSHANKILQNYPPYVVN